MGLFGGPIFWTLERDFFPRQSASQAMGFWRWLNYANEDATNPLLLNMDETSVALRPRAEHGTVATRLKKPGSRAIDAASLQEMRTRFTLMCTICGDTRIQPFLPQVLLTNGRVFGRKPTIPHLKGNLVLSCGHSRVHGLPKEPYEDIYHCWADGCKMLLLAGTIYCFWIVRHVMCTNPSNVKPH